MKTDSKLHQAKMHTQMLVEHKKKKTKRRHFGIGSIIGFRRQTSNSTICRLSLDRRKPYRRLSLVERTSVERHFCEQIFDINMEWRLRVVRRRNIIYRNISLRFQFWIHRRTERTERTDNDSRYDFKYCKHSSFSRDLMLDRDTTLTAKRTTIDINETSKLNYLHIKIQYQNKSVFFFLVEPSSKHTS